MLVAMLAQLGHKSLHFTRKLGVAGLFLMRILWMRPRFLRGFPLLIRELYSIGVLSLLIIVISALFIGMVISLQGENTLQQFGATSALGQLVALSLVRELGPVVSALLFAGRAGSALTAEIGLMKATEQLSCMEMLAVDPLRRIISPRFWAGVISLPILVTIFNAVGILSAYLLAVHWLGVDSGTFWNNMNTGVEFQTDVLQGLFKSVVFGFAISWVAVYQGYHCKPTALGVSQATTRTVVFSSVLVLGLDFVLTALMM